MKKNFFYAGMMAMTIIATAASCSKNDDISAGNNEDLIATGEQIITLDLQDTDVLASRSRPLHSTESKGAADVTNVKLFVFKHETGKEDGDASNTTMEIVRVLSIDRWDENSSGYRYGNEYTLKLEDDDKLVKGEIYTILAVGQNESVDNNYSEPYKIFAGRLSDASSIKEGKNWTVSSEGEEEGKGDLTGKTWSAGSEPGDGFLLTQAKTAVNDDLGITREAEIFSGISVPVNLDIQSDGGFRVNVLMKRQVAGVIGYFSQIPAIVENSSATGTTNWYENYTAVKKIRLVAHNKNTQIDLTHLLGTQNDDATGTDGGDEFIVNGFTSPAEAKVKFDDTAEDAGNDAFIVYEIDLKDWFAEAVEGATDASYWYGTTESAENITFVSSGLPTLGTNADYTKNDGSDSGTLTTPTWSNAYDSNNSNPTVDNNTVLAGEFVIPFKKVDSDNNTFELQLIGEEYGGGTGTNKEIILKSWNVKLDEASIDPGRGDNSYKFNVYRNHLYQIGTRTTDDPDNPGSTGDNPQALDKDQDLVIRINDQWDFIHNMGLE